MKNNMNNNATANNTFWKTMSNISGKMEIGKGSTGIGCNIKMTGINFEEHRREEVQGREVKYERRNVTIDSAHIALASNSSLTGILKVARGAWKAHDQETVIKLGNGENPFAGQVDISCKMELAGVGVRYKGLYLDHTTADKDSRLIATGKLHETRGAVRVQSIELDGSLESVGAGLVEVTRQLREVLQEQAESGKMAVDPAPAKQTVKSFDSGKEEDPDALY